MLNLEADGLQQDKAAAGATSAGQETGNQGYNLHGETKVDNRKLGNVSTARRLSRRDSCSRSTKMYFL